MNQTSEGIRITAAQRQQYRDEGYFLLERALSAEQLQILRDECQSYLEAMHREMDRRGTDVLDLNHRHKRYFISNRHEEAKRLGEVLFSELMADICRAALGDTAYLFNEQYVLKCAEVGMKFAWHQDSGYVGHEHRPYLSCWCALDDMSVANGTVYILPFSRAGGRKLIPHVQESGTNDLVGYHGDDPGIPVVVPAGSIAVFSSVTFHRSGANTTPRLRRVYLAQYSAEPILTSDGTKNWAFAKPFLKNGQRVRSA